MPLTAVIRGYASVVRNRMFDFPGEAAGFALQFDDLLFRSLRDLNGLGAPVFADWAVRLSAFTVASRIPGHQLHSFQSGWILNRRTHPGRVGSALFSKHRNTVGGLDVPSLTTALTCVRDDPS